MDEIRTFFAPIGLVATVASPFFAKLVWSIVLNQRKMMQILTGIDGKNGLLGWKQDADEKLQHVGVTLVAHGERITRNETDIVQVRDRYHKSASATTEAIFKLLEEKG